MLVKLHYEALLTTVIRSLDEQRVTEDVVSQLIYSVIGSSRDHTTGPGLNLYGCNLPS